MSPNISIVGGVDQGQTAQSGERVGLVILWL